MEWGIRSQLALESADPRLREIFDRVKDRCTERGIDCSVLEGYRGPESQAQAKRDGHSMVDWPNSAHNTKPSIAVDAAPYPYDPTNIDAYYKLAAIVLHEAHVLGYRIRWGGMFKRRNGQPWFDGAHYELIRAGIRDE